MAGSAFSIYGNIPRPAALTASSSRVSSLKAPQSTSSQREYFTVGQRVRVKRLHQASGWKDGVVTGWQPSSKGHLYTVKYSDRLNTSVEDKFSPVLNEIVAVDSAFRAPRLQQKCSTNTLPASKPVGLIPDVFDSPLGPPPNTPPLTTSDVRLGYGDGVVDGLGLGLGLGLGFGLDSPLTPPTYEPSFHLDPHPKSALPMFVPLQTASQTGSAFQPKPHIFELDERCFVEYSAYASLLLVTPKCYRAGMSELWTQGVVRLRAYTSRGITYSVQVNQLLLSCEIEIDEGSGRMLVYSEENERMLQARGFDPSPV